MRSDAGKAGGIGAEPSAQAEPSRVSQTIPAWVEGEMTAVDKLEVHRRGLRHPAISVFVMRGRRTLLQRRALGKYHTPGLWANTVCTHPHWGETMAACAARRLREELGVEGLSLSPREPVEYRADVGGGLIEHEVVSLFVADAGPSLRLSPDPTEVMDLRWVDLDALCVEVAADPTAFTPWLRIYLAEHAGRIFGAAAGGSGQRRKARTARPPAASPCALAPKAIAMDFGETECSHPGVACLGKRP